MLKLFANLVVAVSVLGTSAMALPRGPGTDIPATPNNSIIKVATKSQMTAARRSCRAIYGARLAFVSFSGNRFVCHFRKSTKQLTNQAASDCRKRGMKLVKINSIGVKGNRSMIRFTCKKR